MRTYIIGIAGNKNSGKDTVASIINYIFAKGINKVDYNDWYINKEIYDKEYYHRIIHFADGLKDVLSIIYNIPRSCFEDRKYKDDYYYCLNTNSFVDSDIAIKRNYNIIDINKLTRYHTLSDELEPYNESYNLIKLRSLMQYFGTDV